MKNGIRFIALVIILLSIHGFAEIGQAQSCINPGEPPTTTSTFQKTYGTTGNDRVFSCIVAPDGGFVSAGYSKNCTSSDQDACIFKTDNLGTLQWSRSFGSSGTDYATSVVAANNSYLIVGRVNIGGSGAIDNILIAKTDLIGNLLWQKSIGGASEEGAAYIKSTLDGNYIITGSTKSYGSGGWDAFLIKIDSSGNIFWFKTYGTSKGDLANFVIEESDGSFVVTGANENSSTLYDMMLFKTDSEGNLLWAKYYPISNYYENGAGLAKTSNGDYLVVTEEYYNSSLSNGVLYRMDPSGNLRWAKSYNTSISGRNICIERSVLELPDGNIVMGGKWAGSGSDNNSNGSIIKTDSAGNVIWCRTHGSSSTELMHNITELSDGGFLVAGQSNQSGSGGYDGYLVRTDANGIAGSSGTLVTPVVGNVSISGSNVSLTTTTVLSGLTLILNRNSIDFGYVSIGESSTQTVIATNSSSTNSLTIAGVTTIANYTVAPSPSTPYPITLSPGASLSFNVTFTPDSVGNFTGNITFAHNGVGGTTNLPVSGTGNIETNQVQFKIPITITASMATYVEPPLVIGVSGDGPGGVIIDNTYNPDLGTEFGPAGTWREIPAPPDRPSSDYTTKFSEVRLPKTWPIAFGLNPYDYRGFTSATQIDTYLIEVYSDAVSALVSSSTVKFQWSNVLVQMCTDVPGGACKLLKNTGGSTYTEIADMRAVSTVTDPNTAGSNAIKYYIVKTGAKQPPAVTCDLNPSSLNFGNVAIGSSKTLPLTVSNGGGSTVLTGTVAASAPFSISPSSLNVPALGGTQIINVTYTPISPDGTINNSNIVLTTNAGTFSLPVTGICPGPIGFKIPFHVDVSAGTFPDADNDLYFGVHEGNSYGQDMGTEFGPVGTWRETAAPPELGGGGIYYVFNFVEPRTIKTWPIATGLLPYDFRGYSDPMQIDTYAVIILSDAAGTIQSSTMTYSWNPAIIKACIGESGSCKLLKRTSGSTYTEVADMISQASWTDQNSAHENYIKYYIIKTGAIQPPAVILNPSSLNFGNVAIGSSKTLPLTVSNGGGSTVLTGTVAASAPFSINPSSLNIPALGGTQIINVTYTPISPDGTINNSNIVLTTNAGTFSLPVTGICPGPNFALSNSSLDFGTVITGNTGTQTVIVSNLSTTNPLIISGVTSAANYTVTPNPASAYPLTIAANSSRSFDITFTPPSEGTFSGNIVFTHNAAGGIANLAVTGVGNRQFARFKIPVGITISGSATVEPTLNFGVSGDGPGGVIIDNTYGQDMGTEYGAAGTWRETAAPPDRPSFDYTTKFDDFRLPKTWPIATGSNPYDYRGFTSATQVDTYQIKVYGDGASSLVGTSSVIFTWNQVLVQKCTDVPGGACKLLRNTSGTNYVEIADMRAMSTFTDENLSGSNAIKYYIVKTGAKTPPPVQLVVSPNPIVFPATVRGTSATATVTITNGGVSVPLTGTIAASGDFSINVASLNLAPLASVVATVTFTAPAPGGTTQNSNVVFTTNKGVINLPLTGTSLGPTISVSPASWYAGLAQAGSVKTTTVNVTNSSTVALTVSSVTVAAPFAASALTTIAAGATVPMTLTYTAPYLDGTQSDNVVIVSDAYNAPSLSIPVSGTSQTQGGLLVIGEVVPATVAGVPPSKTVGVLDASSSPAGYYDAPIRMEAYAGSKFMGVQFTLVTNGKVRAHAISPATLVDNNCWELTVNPVRGQKLADGTSIDTFYVLLHANDSTCAFEGSQVSNQTLLNMRFDVADIEGAAPVSTSMQLIDILGARTDADDANLNTAFNYNINITNRTLKGDVNQDDHIDILDIIAIVNHIVNKVVITSPSEAFSDADIYTWSAGDGEINIQDLTLLQNIILNGKYPNGQKIEESLDGNAKLAKSDDDGIVTVHSTRTGIALVVDTKEDFTGLQITFEGISQTAIKLSSKVFATAQAQQREDKSVRCLIYDPNGKVMTGRFLLADMSFDNIEFKSVKAIGVIAVGPNGQQSIYRVIVTNLATDLLPTKFALYNNYPNPFNPATTIQFDVMDPSQVRITVYNLLGQEIRTLVNQQMDRGPQSITWDGKDAAGRSLASGIYVYRMQAGSFNEAKKMILLK